MGHDLKHISPGYNCSRYESSDGSRHSQIKTFWKGFSILDVIKNIHISWEGIKIPRWISIWRKLIPSSWMILKVHDFSEGSNGRCGKKNELQLEVEHEDVTELLDFDDNFNRCGVASCCSCSVTKSCPIRCDPMDHSTPGLPPSPRVSSNSCPLTLWCYLTISGWAKEKIASWNVIYSWGWCCEYCWNNKDLEYYTNLVDKTVAGFEKFGSNFGKSYAMVIVGEERKFLLLF